MKTLSKFGILLALAGSLFLSACSGYYTATVPVDATYVRPDAPYAGAVWIDGDWVWRGGAYVHLGGHWEHPRAGRVWVAGSWEHGGHGYRWHKGHWR